MLLVSVQLNGINYRGQNRAMNIALNSKNKLAFVEGKIDVPKDGYEEYEKWRRCNYMVTSWILNSISKDLVGSFLYVTTARELWQLWDELANIVPILACICGSEKLATKIHNANHLMQFLMGLNDTFDQVRSQVLLLDPLPTVNKAFSMVLRVESRKEVQTNLTEHTEVAALAVRSQGNRRDYISTTQGRTTVTTII
uniref:Retrotransposon Copia-like N-terminal domain-containing protein n=1 Tax=Manihot esculenta TaxID=3983 RepID=A0A2C9U155_MANES